MEYIDKSPLDDLEVSEVRLRARQAAHAYLFTHWASGRFPVDPVAIANSVGVEVFNAQLGNDAYGMFVRPAGGGAQIYLDKDQPTNRWRFSCAHELGHFEERTSRVETVPQDVTEVDWRTGSDPYNKLEIFANEFAANLLMPDQDVRSRVEAGLSQHEIASEMGVSLDAIRYRLKRMELTT